MSRLLDCWSEPGDADAPAVVHCLVAHGCRLFLCTPGERAAACWRLPAAVTCVASVSVAGERRGVALCADGHVWSLPLSPASGGGHTTAFPLALFPACCGVLALPSTGSASASADAPPRVLLLSHVSLPRTLALPAAPPKPGDLRLLCCDDADTSLDARLFTPTCALLFAALPGPSAALAMLLRLPRHSASDAPLVWALEGGACGRVVARPAPPPPLKQDGTLRARAAPLPACVFRTPSGDPLVALCFVGNSCLLLASSRALVVALPSRPEPHSAPPHHPPPLEPNRLVTWALPLPPASDGGCESQPPPPFTAAAALPWCGGVAASRGSSVFITLSDVRDAARLHAAGGGSHPSHRSGSAPVPPRSVAWRALAVAHPVACLAPAARGLVVLTHAPLPPPPPRSVNNGWAPSIKHDAAARTHRILLPATRYFPASELAGADGRAPVDLPVSRADDNESSDDWASSDHLLPPSPAAARVAAALADLDASACAGVAGAQAARRAAGDASLSSAVSAASAAATALGDGPARVAWAGGRGGYGGGGYGGGGGGGRGAAQPSDLLLCDGASLSLSARAAAAGITALVSWAAAGGRGGWVASARAERHALAPSHALAGDETASVAVGLPARWDWPPQAAAAAAADGVGGAVAARADDKQHAPCGGATASAVVASTLLTFPPDAFAACVEAEEEGGMMEWEGAAPPLPPRLLALGSRRVGWPPQWEPQATRRGGDAPPAAADDGHQRSVVTAEHVVAAADRAAAAVAAAVAAKRRARSGGASASGCEGDDGEGDGGGGSGGIGEAIAAARAARAAVSHAHQLLRRGGGAKG